MPCAKEIFPRAILGPRAMGSSALLIGIVCTWACSQAAGDKPFSAGLGALYYCECICDYRKFKTHRYWAVFGSET